MNPRRRELLDELRARHNREWAALTPAERLDRADALRSFARAVRSATSHTDEPRELVVELAARRRARTRT